MKEKEYSIDVAGKRFTAVFSDLAEQADGSVLLKCEDTIVLATACISNSGRNNPGFFNLTVEYIERFYAAGLILGGQYNKREGRPSDKAILAARVIDRTIRPLFPQHIKNAVQVVVTVLSVGKMDPNVLAVNAVSLALSTSSIPWAGPVGCVQVGIQKGASEIQVNNYVPYTGEPVYDLDSVICAKNGEVLMIEASTFQKDESVFTEALDKAMAEIAKLDAWQKEILKTESKAKKDFPAPVVGEDIKALYESKIKSDLEKNIFSATESKNVIHGAEDTWAELLEKTIGKEVEGRDATIMTAKDFLSDKINDIVHDAALKDNKRVDMRALDQVRTLYAKAGGFSSVLHGTGIFYRGETHVLSVVTLGGPDDQNVIEGMEVRGKKRFMHHYNFPPYSVGETGRFGGINRREMGHGFLAEKALAPIIPDKEKFPYTIRVVSESTSSNGSTSQGSICGSSIALMDAGVPILAPVAGIAMGVMIDPTDSTKYKILTDIQGPEDHHGDMDFKVAGSKNGLTAIQLDIKVGGIPPAILKDALVGAKKARLEILDVIEKEIPAARKDISPNAPKILITKVKVDQIGMIIGSGGKTVNAIREKTGAELSIEDDGTIYITGKDGAADAALAIVEGMTHEWKIGEIAEATIVRIVEFGAFAKISEFAEGLIHISEIDSKRVEKVSDFLKEGQVVQTKVIKVDQDGKIGLSIKALKQ